MKKIVCLAGILWILLAGLPVKALETESVVQPSFQVTDALGQKIDNVLYVVDKSFFTLSDPEETAQVWIDQKSVDITYEEGIAHVPVLANDKQVQIVKHEQMEKTFTVFSLQPYQASTEIENNAYLLEDHFKITLDSVCKEDVMVRIEKQDQILEEKECQGRQDIDIFLSQSGTYQVRLFYKKAPDQYIPINGQNVLCFTFSNTPPEINWDVLSDLPSSSLSLTIQWPSFLKEAMVLVDGQLTESTSYLELKANPGEEKQCHIELVATDQFERKVRKEGWFKLDGRLPTLSFYHENQLLQPGILHLFSDKEMFHWLWDEEVKEDLEIWVNQQPVQNTALSDIWKSLQNQDQLTLWFTGVDLAGNVNRFRYDIQYVKRPEVIFKPQTTHLQQTEKTVVITTRDPLFGTVQDVQSIQRTWKRTADQKIILEKKERKLIDRTKPVLRFFPADGQSLSALRKGDRIRLTLVNTEPYSKDHFTKIEVNGKSVSLKTLKKDRLQNEYLELELKTDTTEIFARAQDASGNISEIRQTFNLLQKHSFLIWIMVSLGTAGLIASGLIWRHGKIKGH